MQSLSQREAALAAANRIRIARANVRKQLAAGELTLRQALEHDACATAPLYTILAALPSIGPRRTQRLAAAVGVSATRPVNKITEREIDQLERTLAEASWSPRPRVPA